MTDFTINNHTRLRDDKCSIKMCNNDNRKIGDYILPEFLTNKNENNYMSSFDQPGVYQSGNFSDYSENIDNGSQIRNGKYGNIITHSGERMQFPKNGRTNPPFKGAQKEELDTDIMSKLYGGQSTNERKSLRGVEIDRFVPLIPELENQVQNPKHLIPKYWVRGGMDTRVVIRNIDYLKTCGLRR